MIQIRRGVFETNSSSTHSITICSESEFDKWKNGKVYFNDSYYSSLKGEGQWLTKEEAIRAIISSGYPPKENPYDMDSETLDNLLSDEYNIYTYYNYFNDYDYEHYAEDYRTEHGDDIVAFGYYGYC